MFDLQIAVNENVSANSFVRPRIDNRMPSILIVEDDEDSRLMLKLLLEMWKYRVLEAADGIEAVSVAERTCPDLILMDVKLPYLDGFEATRRIRESAIINGVPVIFLSACAEAVYRRAASAVGADEYLVKPLNFEQLENTVDKYISQPQKTFTEKFLPVKCL